MADDAVFMARQVAEALERAGAEVIGPAGDGTQALQLWLAHKPPMAVLDFQMPGLNGLQVVQAIRAAEQRQHPEAPCFLVILSSHAEPSIAERCLDEGADLFLDKRCDFDDLQDIVRRVAQRASHGGLPSIRIGADGAPSTRTARMHRR